jgi:hypothetical protein
MLLNMLGNQLTTGTAFKQTANTGLLYFNGRLLALMEASKPYEMVRAISTPTPAAVTLSSASPQPVWVAENIYQCCAGNQRWCLPINFSHCVVFSFLSLLK